LDFGFWILDFADEIMGRKLPYVLQQAGLKSKRFRVGAIHELPLL
jgi:hypothetical protein